MPRQVQHRVLEMVEAALGTSLVREVSPDWLKRPGKTECGRLWPTVQSIYADLTDGGILPDTMPPRERRRIDAVLTGADGVPRIVEVDEVQVVRCPLMSVLRPRVDSVDVSVTLGADRSGCPHRA